MDGDETGGALILRIAEPRDDPCIRSAEAGPRRHLETDEFARFGVMRRAACNAPFLQLLAIDRIDNAAPAGKRAEDAEMASGCVRQLFDRPRLVGKVGVGEGSDAR